MGEDKKLGGYNIVEEKKKRVWCLYRKKRFEWVERRKIWIEVAVALRIFRRERERFVVCGER